MEISFEMDPRSGHMDVPVTVNGEGPLRFHLDTGAVATSLSMSLREKLGIKTREDVDGKYKRVGFEYTLANLDEFSIGHELRRNEEVMVFRLLGGENRISGNIGHSTLKDYALSINYSRKTIRLGKGGWNEKEPSSWTTFDYIDDTHLVGVPVYINDQGPFELVLDTGSPIILLSPDLADNLGLKLSGDKILVKGLGGTAEAQFGTLEQTSVGTANQQDLKALVVDPSAISPRGKTIHYGILGNSFLSNYEVIIDYPNKRLALVS